MTLISAKGERFWPILGHPLRGLGRFSAAGTRTGSGSGGQNMIWGGGGGDCSGFNEPNFVKPRSDFGAFEVFTSWGLDVYQLPGPPFDRFCVGLWYAKPSHRAKGDNTSYCTQLGPNIKPGRRPRWVSQVLVDFEIGSEFKLCCHVVDVWSFWPFLVHFEPFFALPAPFLSGSPSVAPPGAPLSLNRGGGVKCCTASRFLAVHFIVGHGRGIRCLFWLSFWPSQTMSSPFSLFGHCPVIFAFCNRPLWPEIWLKHRLLFVCLWPIRHHRAKQAAKTAIWCADSLLQG